VTWGVGRAEALRADPHTSKIPVVVISADATPKQIDRLLAAGASDYLAKPLDVRRLLDLVSGGRGNGERPTQ
jgi:CheY-like chemotaxis protein